MSQVKMTCPKCKEKFQAEKADIYECPKCGTNVRAKNSNDPDQDATQRFTV
jgi:Zn finger protein HypA/HybF involved in hydrogenase expression